MRLELRTSWTRFWAEMLVSRPFQVRNCQLGQQEMQRLQSLVKKSCESKFVHPAKLRGENDIQFSRSFRAMSGSIFKGCWRLSGHSPSEESTGTVMQERCSVPLLIT